MTMNNIKETYFNLPARGECIRLILAYGEKKFDDIRFDTECLEKWYENKHKFPFGHLPTYEQNGRVAYQTVAILRYLGKQIGLVGEDDWENLEIDSIADTFTDFALNYHYEQSAKEKHRKKEYLLKQTITYYLEKFEDVVNENDGHLALNKLSWVDFYWAGFIEYLSWMIDMDVLEKYPNLKAVQNNVFQLPAVVAWYKEHPKDIESAKRWITKSGTPKRE